MSIKNVNNLSYYPLDSYTKLLVKFNGDDEATTYTAETGQTVTFEGTAQLDTAQSKFGESSLLLDGNSDYVTVPDSDDWNFGTEDFTIDCFVRFSDLTGRQYICGQVEDANSYWYLAKIEDTHTLRFFYRYNTNMLAYYETSSRAFSLTDTWFHVALVRNGTNIYMFVNGVLQLLTITTTISTNDLGNITSDFNIGLLYTNLGINGWIDSFRISKGIARWTSNFTPPINIKKINNSYNYLIDDDTKLLIKFNGDDEATTYTAETGQTVTFEGTAQLDTAQSKFGGSSLLLDGDSDYVTVPDSDDWNFGTGDFTIDCWTRWETLPSASNYDMICGQFADSNNYWYMTVYNNAGSYIIYFILHDNSTTRLAFSFPLSLSTNTWYHLAISRNGNTWYGFQNGASKSLTKAVGDYTASFVDLATTLSIGKISTNYFQGWIDSIRISKGIARWVSNFTPPIDIAKINGIAI